MTPEQVASAIAACHHPAANANAVPGVLLALAGLATEYLAATDAWNAASYVDAELLGAAARLEQADRELRTALGLPHLDAPTELGLSPSEAPPDAQTTFEFSASGARNDPRTTR
ncbi:MAG TPA: hypothetical protein VIX73_08220 [Kofleriaceae bacterium]|jgi:hypothetical protein